MKSAGVGFMFLLFAFALACGGGGGMGSGGGGSSITVLLANSSTQVFQGEPSVTVNVSVTRAGSSGSVTLIVSGLPVGASDTIQSPGSGNMGSITFNAGTATPGTYSLTITASDGTVSGNATLSLAICPSVIISNGKTGPFSVAMSTSFQPAEWDYQFFTTNPAATTTLGTLQPKHIRLQAVSEGVPQGSEGTNSTAWNFSILDSIVQPVLSVGDHSPEFQIAKAPPFMYENDDSSDSFADTTFAQFAGYAQNLVEYYDTGGFTANGGTYVSPSYPTDKVTWWGIYNEPNINNNLTPQQYTTMYNAVVPAMQATDPSIKFAALELADFSGQVSAWVPTFVSGVTAHVDVMATHFYSSCDQKDTDAQVFNTIPGFVTDVQAFYADMATNPALSSVPVWVTENNVNADFANANGMSTCNPGQVFVTDVRGTSPFFAAWRPYVFSQLGKAGVQALYHWDFDADQQYGEVLYGNDQIELSYWVDYWLGQTFPTTAGSQLLEFSSTDEAELETLPVINSDGSVVVMVANHAVNNPSTDNNGPGIPRTVLVDVSSLGTFSTGSLITIDLNTNAGTGPTPTTVSPAGQMILTLNGYSVALLTLKP
jgi:hypothetical protein